ncbi:MAG: hypothetical protein AB7H77_02785 [Bdellovibrionales bacterium]
MQTPLEQPKEIGFVASLQFLKREAERTGQEELSTVLKTALALVSGEKTGFDLELDAFLKDAAAFEESHLVIDFLFRFLLSSDSVKESVIRAIEEEDEM